jgi:hypothetical protein
MTATFPDKSNRENTPPGRWRGCWAGVADGAEAPSTGRAAFMVCMAFISRKSYLIVIVPRPCVSFFFSLVLDVDQWVCCAAEERGREWVSTFNGPSCFSRGSPSVCLVPTNRWEIVNRRSVLYIVCMWMKGNHGHFLWGSADLIRVMTSGRMTGWGSARNINRASRQW